MASTDIEFKAMPGQFNIDEAQGMVECFVAGIGNKDSVGDVLISGAFAKSLQRRKPRVVWGHNWNDPIGKVLEIYEVAPGDRRLPSKMLNAGIGGLYARVQFNLNSEKGREAFANVAFFGQEQEWSIGYKTLDAIFDPNMQANVLKEVELYEVSPVLHGANQLTGTISVKSDDAVALADSEKGWGMMGPHHMMGQMPQKPNMIVIREDDDDKYESEKPIFAEGLAQPLGGDQRQRLEREISERTNSKIKLIEATESTAVFMKFSPNGAPTVYRIGYHTPDNYSTFMFGKPEVTNSGNSGSRTIVPSQMPSMPMQVKPGYEQGYGDIMPKSDEKSDLASQIEQLEDLIAEEIDEKVGKTINKRNLSKLKAILEGLQDVISSAEKEDLETKGYLIPLELEEAFSTKSLLDPIFDYHRVESVVTEDGILITSGVTKDLVEAIDNAQKGIGRSIGGKPGKGRAAGRAAFSRFDPKAWDGDGDGLVQEGTPFQRPAIPGVNDRATGGKVNARRAAMAFASESGGLKPQPISVSGDVISKNDLPKAMVTDIENAARRAVDYRTGNETSIIEGAEEVLKSLTDEKLKESVGKSISNARRKLAEMLSDEKVIEEFSSRKAIEDFTDELRYAIEKMIDSHLDSVKKTGTGLEQDEIEEIVDNAKSKFDNDFDELIKAAKDFWNTRRKPGRLDKTVKEAQKEAALDRNNLMTTLRDGGEPEDLESVLGSILGNYLFNDNREGIISGTISLEDLNYEIEKALNEIIDNDPSIDPKELVNEFGEALREGASKDSANPLIVALAKEFGDEKITGGDLIDYLNDTRQSSRYRPDRGKIEKEKIRGFASTTQRMDREEDGADYDEAFGPRSRRTNRGMREDPVGEEVAERIDRDSQNAAVREGFASASSGKWKGKKPEDKDIKPGADLSGADLTDTNLRGVNLTGANLTGANLEDANLTDAVLTDANLRDANLTGANLRAANLRDANLRYADMNGADLTSAFMEGANLEEAYLRKANLTNANLTGAEMTRVDLVDANLSGANLTDAKMKRSDLVGADLRGTKMTGVDLGGALLEGVDLSGKDMRGAILGGARLDGAKLFGADLRKANLEGVDLTGQDLRGVDFAGANLSGANLTKAKLEGADLTDTDFTGATMPDGKPYKDSASARGFASSDGGKNRIVRPTGIQRDERGNVDATEARNMRAERDKAVFEKLRELGLSDEEIEQLTGVPNGGRNVEQGDISQDELDELNTVIDEGIAEGLESGEITGVVSREEARRILKDNEGLSRVNPGLASSSQGGDKKISPEDYQKIQESLDKIIDGLESGDSGADDEIEKLSELSSRIGDGDFGKEVSQIDNEELTNYLGILESMQDSGFGMDGSNSKDKSNIDSLVDVIKNAQKTSGTTGAVASSSKLPRKKITKDGALTPQKNLSITLDDDLVGLLNEEVDMLLDNTKNRQPLLGMKKILEESKNGKFEVTPKQFDDITAAIEDAFDNGVVTSDVYGVLHQAAESLDGKYDLNEINNPKKAKGFASSGRRANNGAPTDMTELQQRQYVAWARQQRGLRVAQEIIQEHDSNSGQMSASRWKALRTMYSNMGPGSAGPRRFASNTSQPTGGFRDAETFGPGPLPYVYTTTGWKKIGGAGGLNEAGKYTDPKTGKVYYVKHSRSGEEFRGETEILTSKLYQLLGVPTIDYNRGVHNGKLQRVSVWDDRIKEVSHSQMSRDPKFKASVQRSLIANAWLANWDGTGNMSNIVQGPNGEAVMADSGGGLIFRAQRYSGLKSNPPFGPKVDEVENLINGVTRSGQSVQTGVSRAYYKDIEPSEVARQVKELSQVTDEDIKKLVSQQISDPSDGDRLAQLLIARRDWIVDHWSTGKMIDNPPDTSRSDASGAKAKPFASLTKKPSGSVSASRVGFASSIDGPGDDERGGGVRRARGVGEMVPGGALEGNTRNRESGVTRGEGRDTQFAGKTLDEIKPDNWDELTTDEKWQWAITQANPDNGSEMSRVAYRKLLVDLGDEMDKEELAAMSPAERRAELAARKSDKRIIENMGVPEEPEEGEEAKPKPKRQTSSEPKVPKIKKSSNAQDAKTERESRLDQWLEAVDASIARINSNDSEIDRHRDLWDEVSISMQDNGYDFSIKSIDRTIEILEDYVSEFEDEQLTPGERANVTAAKKILKTLLGAKTAYTEDEWIIGSSKASSGKFTFTSATAGTSKKFNINLAKDIQQDLKKLNGTGKPGTRGFASTSAGGKTMITDEATFFKDVQSSLDKEIRRATKDGDKKAVAGLRKLSELISSDEAGKTGSRRTNVGSIYFTAEEADQMLDGLMFALDTQLADGGEKRIGWYSKLIEMIAGAAKSTFIDKKTNAITDRTRTGTNSRGQSRTINIVPEA